MCKLTLAHLKKVQNIKIQINKQLNSHVHKDKQQQSEKAKQANVHEDKVESNANSSVSDNEKCCV